MQTRNSEILVGIFMILAILALIFLALKVSGLSTESDLFGRHSYELTAQFNDIGSLKVRAPVRIAGVEVGRVVGISLNNENFEAKVTMKIDDSVNDLPIDTSAAITSSGILGDNYVNLTPGYASTNLKEGGEITTTYSATNLQSLISTFMSGGNKANASH
jgi:phospholipid/cholesterol/gamma-HCH transport system substrate-binding protein